MSSCCEDSETKTEFNTLSETQKCFIVGGQIGTNRCNVVDVTARHTGVKQPVYIPRHNLHNSSKRLTIQ